MLNFSKFPGDQPLALTKMREFFQGRIADLCI